MGAVTLLTVGGGALLYRAKRPAALTIPKDRTTSGLDQSADVRGNPKAPVTLEEFGDFECPPCGNLAPVITQIGRDYGQELRAIFHHFPLMIHAHARQAAFAAEAAGLQKDRFWEMHDLLYREQEVWSKAVDSRPLFNAYAGMLGLNIDRFKKDMESDQVKLRVNSDEKRGNEIGVTITPTVFVNNRAVAPPSLNDAGLRSAIKEAAAQAKEKPK